MDIYRQGKRKILRMVQRGDIEVAWVFGPMKTAQKKKSNLGKKVDFVRDHRRQTTLLLKRVIELQDNAQFQSCRLGKQ